eukprot:1160401-Pelagomonas_calceolata.AAC.6
MSTRITVPCTPKEQANEHQDNNPMHSQGASKGAPELNDFMHSRSKHRSSRIMTPSKRSSVNMPGC